VGSPSAEEGRGCSTYSACAVGVEVVLGTRHGDAHEAGKPSIGWPALNWKTLTGFRTEPGAESPESFRWGAEGEDTIVPGTGPPGRAIMTKAVAPARGME